MSLSPDHPVSVFLHVVGACWRQKFKACLAFCAVAGLAATAWTYAPRTYESEARLFVRVGRETVALDPSATVGQTIGMQDSRETEINSLMEILKSRSLHEAVVDELGVAQVLGEGSTDGAMASDDSASPMHLVSLPTTSTNGATVPASSQREKAVQQLGKSITVSSPRRSTVISIESESTSPQLAQAIVRSLVNAYKKEHIRLHRVPGSFDFFTERAARTEADVKSALKELNDAKSELSIATVQGRRDSLEKQISSLEQQAQAIAADLDSANARVASLEKLIKDLPSEIEGISTTGYTNDAHTKMRELLYGLEIKEHDLRSKYRDGHPAVIALRKQVDDARKVLTEQPMDRTQKEMIPNPAIRAVDIDLVKGRSEAAALQAKAKTLSEQKLTVAEELRDLHHEELHLADLERELESRKAAHAEAITRLEQARINHEMENNSLSNVSVIQEATLVEKPTSPRLSLFGAAALLAACFCAVGLALAWDLAFPPHRKSMVASASRELPANRIAVHPQPAMATSIQGSE